MPPLYKIEEVLSNYPIKYEESMNTVLVQELIRYNKLIGVVSSSLKNVVNAIEGLVVMNVDLEKIFNSILNNQVPEVFHKVLLD